MAEDAALTRFANSQIHQNVAERNVVVNLRFVVGQRVGVASTGRTDDEGLRRLAVNAAAITRVIEELEDWSGLPEPTPIREARAAYATGHRRRHPGASRRGRARRDRGRRRGRGDGLRLLLDRFGEHGRRQLARRPRRAARGRWPSS